MQTLVVIKKEAIFQLESWLALGMTLVSAAFLVFDVAEHGIWFKGSLVSLLVGTLTTALLAHAQRREISMPQCDAL